MMTYYRKVKDLNEMEKALSLNLREEDKREARAYLGTAPEVALAGSILRSEDLWIVVHNNSIEGVFGVCRGDDFGIPWFLSTDKFKEFKITFAKESKEVVRLMVEKYGRLENYVSGYSYFSLKWLLWLGFNIDATEYYFADPGVPFYKFTKEVNS